MPNQAVLVFVQNQLDMCRTNEEILQELFNQFSLDISKRTLQRWVKQAGLERPGIALAIDRSAEWIEDIQNLIKRGIILKDIVYHVNKTYNETLSLRTLERLLMVHQSFCGLYLRNSYVYVIRSWASPSDKTSLKNWLSK